MEAINRAMKPVARDFTDIMSGEDYITVFSLLLQQNLNMRVVERAEIELERYLAVDDVDGETDPLKWWREH